MGYSYMRARAPGRPPARESVISREDAMKVRVSRPSGGTVTITLDDLRGPSRSRKTFRAVPVDKVEETIGAEVDRILEVKAAQKEAQRPGPA